MEEKAEKGKWKKGEKNKDDLKKNIHGTLKESVALN
jgi:hypothetical protein